MYRSIPILIIIFCVSILIKNISATTFGSDTDPVRYDTQQQVRSGDLIAGFGAMAGGMAFFDTSDTVTFDSFFGVSGYNDLNGGTLVLYRDLIMQDEGYFQSIGNIQGNGHTVSLAPNMTRFPLGPYHNCGMSPYITLASITQTQSAGWSYDGKYLAISGSGQIGVYQFDGSTNFQTIVTVSNPSGVAASANSQLKWHPSAYRLGVVRRTATVSHLLLYTFDEIAPALSLQSTASFSNNQVNTFAWHPSGQYIAATSGGAVSPQIILYPVNPDNTLDQINTFTQTSGVFFTSIVSSDWNITGSYYAIAAGQAFQGGIRIFRFSPLPTPSFTANFGPASIWASGVAWHKTLPLVFGAVGSSINPQVRMYQFNETPGNFSLLASVQTVGSNLNIDWASDHCFAVNCTGASRSLRTFSFDYATSVTQVKLVNINTISGLVDPSFTFAYNRAYDGAYLALPIEGASSVPIFRSVTLGPPPPFVFSDVNLLLNNNTFYPDANILFRGNCSINGNDNIFAFAPNSLFKVDTASSLLLSNVVIEAIKNGKISCTDSSSTITFNNATMQFDTSFSFTAGRIDVLGSLKLTGSGSFDYRSTESLTVLSNSTLIIDLGMTFSYSPNNLSNSLLQFLDNTSEFVLNGGSLVVSATGLNVTKGSLIVDGSSNVRAIGTAAARGFIVGDGVDSSNNMAVTIKPAAILSCNGFIVDNNV